MDLDLDTLVSRARTKAGAGKLDAAVAAYREVVKVDRAHLEANAFLAKKLLERGDATGAIRHGELAIDASPADLALHQTLAAAHLKLLKQPDAEKKLVAICKELPFAYASLLHLSRLQEIRGDRRAALVGYTRAIHTAHLRGFWHAEHSTPPWLRAAVQHAMSAAQAGKLGLFDEWLRAMWKRHGKDEMRRVADCIAMYLGTRPTVYADPRQKPSFLYFPGLPITPVFERDALPFADWYEACAGAIRDEMRAVLDSGGDDVLPFHYDVPEERRDKLTRGAWDAYFFFEDGERNERHHAACPQTSSALARLPLDHVRDHGPEVCFSIMRPGAQILPHRGVTNTRSVLHLGLVIPDGCALKLTEVQEIAWQEGRCFAFDDTYEHEAWNRSDTTRVVLLGDIWNPHLREPEREAIAELVGFIGDFNRETAPAR
jgi:aspartate beta-hydroxylase